MVVLMVLLLLVSVVVLMVASGGYVFCGVSLMSLLLMGFFKYMDVRRCSLFQELSNVFSRW
jgi:hypothetical protein